MPNFGDILTKTAESIERPPLPPKGTYVLVVTKAPDKQDRGEYEAVDFPMKAVRPTEDVDADELKAFGSPNNILVRKSFLFNTKDEAAFKNTEFNLRNFLVEHLGLPADLTLKELMTMSVGKQCLGVIDYRPNKENPEIIYTDLKRTAPLE
jgi:hypothetical protein